jgi:RimJ/RimL family protein N-acetyltransferase
MATTPGLEQATWNPASVAGDLVTLRRHRPQNLDAISRWYRDPELSRLTRYSLRPMPQEEVDRFFATRLLSPGSVAYGIHERGSDRLIGLTTFSSLDADNGSVLFHITIGERDAWGRGMGTEATRLMLWLAFERMGLHRVSLSVFAFNERAIRAYRRAGFVEEGRLRGAIARDGTWWDEVLMGILRDDWLASQAPAPRSVG